MPAPLLSIQNLVAGFHSDAGLLHAVDDVSFDIEAGQTVALVGESGSGKSVTALSIVDLLPKPVGQVISGQIFYNGEDLAAASTEQLTKIRGSEVGMIFQEPMTALNPVMRVGKQVAEGIVMHRSMDKKAAQKEAVELLNRVGIPAPEQRARDYPHQLSGGMRQRVGIAIALAARPKLLIADEPTTALDVTVQAQIIDLLQDLQAEQGSSMLFITHNLSLVEKIADEIVVMYAGRVVEKAPAATLFSNPRHRYTKGLLDSMPRLDSLSKSLLPTIPGTVPALADMPEGCRFAPRSRQNYSKADMILRPQLVEVGERHWVEDSRSVLLPK